MVAQLNISEILASTGLTLEQLIAQGKAAEVQKKAEDTAAIEGEKSKREVVTSGIAEDVASVEFADIVASLSVTFLAKRSDTGLDDGIITIAAPDALYDRLWEVLSLNGADELKSIKSLSVVFKPGTKGVVEVATAKTAKTPGTSTGTGAARNDWNLNGGEKMSLKGAFAAAATPAELAEYATKVGGSNQWQYKNAIVTKAGYKKG